MQTLTFLSGKSAPEFGTRTEMKNLNSFKAIARAIEGERERQIELLEAGRVVVQETSRWDDNKESSHAMRSKEDAKDYRYFPDPDLVPIVIDDEWIEKDQSKNSRNSVMKNWNVIKRVRYSTVRCRNSHRVQAYGGYL